ncbi:46144_t:CDS:1, partial [Gigaspora margarita]
IHDSNENVQEVIQELKNHCEIGYKNPSFLECKGVSRNVKLCVPYFSYL